mmetsp:Transcript_136992/g.438271  ORF Transcript_136992/g.438271 Transcript_136992/m.438271 type:complete len:83 (+) Transcript_136992:2498-2746(+)
MQVVLGLDRALTKDSLPQRIPESGDLLSTVLRGVTKVSDKGGVMAGPCSTDGGPSVADPLWFCGGPRVGVVGEGEARTEVAR